MTSLNRVRVGWSGFPGAPGVSTFYFLDVATAVASLVTLFDSIKAAFPSDVTWRVESAGDVINDVNGDLTGAWGADPVSDVAGTASGAYSAPVGGMYGWDTSTILDGHRLKGKTFLVPLSAASYDGSGTLSSGCLAVLEPAGIEFLAEQSTSFVIWHRPRAAKAADGSRKAVTARDGGHGLVTTSRVPDKSIVLRSRRD